MSQFLLDPAALAPDGSSGLLRGTEAHHLLRVHRARPGDRVRLFDGQGHRWEGRLTASRGVDEAVIADLEAMPPNEPPWDVRLVQSIPKGDRWTWILEKATELGASEIIPVRSRFTVVGSGDGGRRDRWTAVAAAAAKQCERGKIPVVSETVDLAAYLLTLGSPAADELRLVCLERTEGRPTGPFGPPRRLTLAVGPEGGWSPEEVGAFRSAGFEGLSLGPRVLRAETAALAALVWAQVRWGDLVAPSHP